MGISLNSKTEVTSFSSCFDNLLLFLFDKQRKA